MNDQHNFSNQDFNTFDPPRRRVQPVARDQGVLENIVGGTVRVVMRNPLIGISALAVAVLAFSSVLYFSYPKKDATENVPVIEAQTTAFKEAPVNPNGEQVAFEDSTVFQSLRDDKIPEAAPIENLLADQQPAEEPVDRFAFEDNQNKVGPEVVAAPDADAPDSNLLEPSPPATELAKETPQEAQDFAIQKIEKPDEVQEQKVAAAVSETPATKPKEIHAAGSSPETLEYVRSVLDQKDGKEALDAPVVATSGAEKLAAIEPAAGAAAVAPTAIAPGGFFVQLGSVRTETGAHSEWSKFQKTYGGLLQDVSYRVHRADLDSGTFYRIQAGPMSKESANSLCDSIKAQKPGGCLVTR